MEGTKYTLFLFLIIFDTFAANQFMINDDDDNLLTKLIEIYNKYPDEEYQHRTNVIVIETKNKIENYFLRYVNKREDSKTVVVNLVEGCNTNEIQESYSYGVDHVNMMVIFMTPTVDTLENILNCLRWTYVWKPLSRTLLVFDKDPGRSMIANLFISVWKQKILNFSILTKSNTSTKVFGFNPFFNNFYETSLKDVFYNKLTNLNGYKLNLLLGRNDDISKVWIRKFGNNIEYHGKDGHMISSILRHVNASFQVVLVDKLVGIEVNPWRTMNFGVYEHLKGPIIKNTSADFLFESRDVIVNNYTDILYPHGKDDYVIMVSRREVSQQKYVLELFEKGLIYFIFLLLLVCPIICFIIRVIANRIRLRSKNGSVSDDIFRGIELLVGISTTRLPKCPAEKIFFIIMLLSCLVVNNYFQSILKSVLTVSEVEPEIDTIKKLAESGVKIKCPKNLVEQIKMFFQGTPQMSLIPNFEDVTRAQVTMVLKSHGMGGGCANLDRIQFYLISMPEFYVVKESLIPNYISIHVVRDSPYSEVLQKNIRRIIESGMYDMWKKQTLHQFTLINKVDDHVVGKIKSFDLYQFRFAFYFIGSGLLISIITFIIEITNKNICGCIKI